MDHLGEVVDVEVVRVFLFEGGRDRDEALEGGEKLVVGGVFGDAAGLDKSAGSQEAVAERDAPVADIDVSDDSSDACQAGPSSRNDADVVGGAVDRRVEREDGEGRAAHTHYWLCLPLRYVSL